MKQVNWEMIDHFTPGEFSENPIYAEPALIYAFDISRGSLKQKMRPSPVKGALARFMGNKDTEHYAVGRRSTAGDVFCEGYPIINFVSLVSLRLFNGIGIYLDTIGPDGLPWVMFHLDIRKKGFDENNPLIWFCEKINGINVYTYPQYDLTQWRKLRYERLYETKQFRNTSAVGSVD